MLTGYYLFKCDPFRQQQCLPPITASDRPLQRERRKQRKSSNDTRRHQPAQQRNAARLAWQSMLALHTLIHNMNYSHNLRGLMQYSSPLPSSLIFQSSLSPPPPTPTHTHAHTHIFSPLFRLFGPLLIVSSSFFPPRRSFSVDVWSALQPRGDAGSVLPRAEVTGGEVCSPLSGGWKESYVSECWERRAIDGIRTRLAVLENWASLSREGRLESQVTH